ncbi:DMT family transporter [Planococcus lenghuensis]|uniref:EamA family transporter n=1 Tax=Planococcus lenghuensis TaxID=2213202 RepID=A0A1Q2L1Q1_9BACL|nr:DMT family transporter [Planococcus lenghuensis]AQQ54343.1 EamA family transporter [Planococcus lenghuensis]
MRYKYSILLLLTSLLWAGNFVMGKWLVGHASPITLTSLRWLIAIVCLLPFIMRQGKTALPPRQALLPLLLMGLTGVALFNTLQFLALDHTSATNVGLISTLNTVSIAIFSVLLLKDKISAVQTVAIALSLAGVVLVLSKGSSEVLLSLEFNRGDVYMLAAVGIWGIYSVCSKWAMMYVTPLAATFYSGIAGLLVLLPYNAADFHVTDITGPFIGALLYTGVISTVVCFVLWNIGVQKLGAASAGIYLNFNPIFTAILAFLLLGEQMTGTQLAGSAIVIAGCYVFTAVKAKKPAAHLPADTEQELQLSAESEKRLQANSS